MGKGSSPLGAHFVTGLIAQLYIHSWMNEWMNEWTNERMNEWTNEWMDELLNEWMYECMNKWMNQLHSWFYFKPPLTKILNWVLKNTSVWKPNSKARVISWSTSYVNDSFNQSQSYPPVFWIEIHFISASRIRVANNLKKINNTYFSAPK